MAGRTKLILQVQTDMIQQHDLAQAESARHHRDTVPLISPRYFLSSFQHFAFTLPSTSKNVHIRSSIWPWSVEGPHRSRLLQLKICGEEGARVVRPMRSPCNVWCPDLAHFNLESDAVQLTAYRCVMGVAVVPDLLGLREFGDVSEDTDTGCDGSSQPSIISPSSF